MCVCELAAIPDMSSLHLSLLRRHSLSCTKSLNPQMSGEEEDSGPAAQLGMCNREIVRRGALILFCDYVVSVKNVCEGG